MTNDENADWSPLYCFSFVVVLNPQTVVELFYQNVARKAIMSQIFSQQDVGGNQTMLHWPQMISSVLTLLCQFLYPLDVQYAGNLKILYSHFDPKYTKFWYLIYTWIKKVVNN